MEMESAEEFEMKKIVSPTKIKGIITIPASKSDGQRALLSAALAKGHSVLTGLGKSDDEMAMLTAIQELGAKVIENPDGSLTIEGGLYPKTPKAICAGESGLGIRLLTAVSSTFDQEITINGRGALTTRPMDFFAEVLPKFGAKVKLVGGKIPIIVHGPLTGGKFDVDGSLSSQFVSGCLMALPLAESDSVLTANNLSSIPYVQMTLNTLSKFGILIERKPGNMFLIKAPQNYKPANYHVEADWSSASYFLVAAAIGHDVKIKGLNLASVQADKMLLDALMSAGCRINFLNGEISIDGSNKEPFEFDATHCPDLFPALVVLAGSIEGESIIHGAQRLTHKESNRALTLKEEFGKLGIIIDLEDDMMRVHGTGKFTGGKVYSHLDHRIAMSLAVAGTIASGDVEIENAESVSKSFPTFWEELERLMV